MMFLGNTAENTAPSPLLFTPGVTLPYVYMDIFEFQGTYRVWGTQYELTDTRIYPSELENRDYLVLALQADSIAGIHLPIGEKVTFYAGGGLTVLFRFPFDLFPEEDSGGGSAFTFLYDKARFIYPVISTGIQWKYRDNMGIGFTYKLLLPLFHAWDGEGLPFSDQMIMDFDIGIRFYLEADPVEE